MESWGAYVIGVDVGWERQSFAVQAVRVKSAKEWQVVRGDNFSIMKAEEEQEEQENGDDFACSFMVRNLRDQLNRRGWDKEFGKCDQVVVELQSGHLGSKNYGVMMAFVMYLAAAVPYAFDRLTLQSNAVKLRYMEKHQMIEKRGPKPKYADNKMAATKWACATMHEAGQPLPQGDNLADICDAISHAVVWFLRRESGDLLRALKARQRASGRGAPAAAPAPKRAKKEKKDIPESAPQGPADSATLASTAPSKAQKNP